MPRSSHTYAPACCTEEKALAAVPSIGRTSPVAAPGADATHALYERYARRIYTYCYHQLSSREEAEDAVQTTFMNAFNGLKRGVVVESEQAWLFKIAENVCLARRRSSWRRGRIESPNDFELLQELVPSRGGRSADELIGLEDALAAMPENQRRAILLREWQGLSYREIAGELELTQGAVETLIFRARRTLAKGLEEPQSTKKRRLGEGLNLGALLAGLKSLLTGGAAVKAVAVAVAAGTATVAAHETEHAVVHHLHAKATLPVVVTPRAQAAFSPQTSLVTATGTPAATAQKLLHRVSLHDALAATVAAYGRAALPPVDEQNAATPAPPPAVTPPSVTPPATEPPKSTPSGGTPAVDPPKADPKPEPTKTRADAKTGADDAGKGKDKAKATDDGDAKRQPASAAPPSKGRPTATTDPAPQSATDAKDAKDKGDAKEKGDKAGGKAGGKDKGNGNDKKDDQPAPQPAPAATTPPTVTPPPVVTPPAPSTTGNDDKAKGNGNDKKDQPAPQPPPVVTPPPAPTANNGNGNADKDKGGGNDKRSDGDAGKGKDKGK